MGKSIRSKIKKYWRSQLRQTLGKDHLIIQENKIQEELSKAMESQEGSSILKLKQSLGTNGELNISEEMAVDNSNNQYGMKKLPPQSKAYVKKDKFFKSKQKNRKNKKKLVHFHKVLKKGS